MDKFRKVVQKNIAKNKRKEIIKILNILYSVLNKYTKNDKIYWTKLYMFDDFVNYIITNYILSELNSNAEQYFRSYIINNCFPNPPPIYPTK